MRLEISYYDHDKECVFMCGGSDIKVKFLTDKGMELIPIPPEEYRQGFELKEKSDVLV